MCMCVYLRREVKRERRKRPEVEKEREKKVQKATGCFGVECKRRSL